MKERIQFVYVMPKCRGHKFSKIFENNYFAERSVNKKEINGWSVYTAQYAFISKSKMNTYILSYTFAFCYFPFGQKLYTYSTEQNQLFTYNRGFFLNLILIDEVGDNKISGHLLVLLFAQVKHVEYESCRGSTEVFVLELTGKAIFREKRTVFRSRSSKSSKSSAGGFFFASSNLKITAPKLETSQHSGLQSSNLF